MWRAEPSSSVPISCVTLQSHLLVGLVDEQLHHVELVGGQLRDALGERARGGVELRLRDRLRGEAPLDRLRAVDRVAGEQHALRALEPEPVDPHRGRRRAPDARGRVADAAVSEQTIRSEQSAKSVPPPTQKPCTCAITGFGERQRRM